MIDTATTLLEAMVRTATPLALAALGETVSERAGVINLGMEGAIIGGCLGAVVGSLAGGAALGVAAGMAAGALVAAVFAVFAVGLRADQIITGTAITLGAYGATGALYRIWFGESGVTLTLATMSPIRIPFLAAIPLIGPAFFHQAMLTYAAYGLTAVLAWWLFRTQSGLGLRACGDHPWAAEASGVSVARVRWIAVVGGGSLGGLAGAFLVLSQVGTFAEQMSAGRGFMAVAIVALGRWTPWGALGAALLFGAATALQYQIQALGLDLPYQLFLALPYVLTLTVLALGAGRGRAPAALGSAYP